MKPDTYTSANCLCGAVSIEIPASLNEVEACHCGMCRTWGGGPFMAIHCGADIRFSGETHISRYSSSEWAERGFCKDCGTHLFYHLLPTGEYMVPAGLLDDLSSFRFTQQIFIEEKPGLYAFANDTRKLTGEEAFALYAGDSDDAPD